MSRPALAIRRRLTLYYGLVVLLILVVFSAAIYAFMYAWLARQQRAKLEEGYALVAGVLVNSGGDIYDVYHLNQDLLFRVERITDRAAFDLNDYQSTAWAETEALAGKDAGWSGSGYAWRTDRQNRRYAVKYGLLDQLGIQLVYAREISNVSADLHSLLLILLLLIPLAVAVAWLSGSAFARRALAPVEELTQRAREITAESLAQRLPVSNPEDELGRLALVFNELLARLEASFAQLKRFTADAAHELRTPLTAIRSRGEVALRAKEGEAECCEALVSILEETEYIRKVLDNLLLLSRADAGTAELQRDTVDLAALAAEVAADLQVLAEERQQQLTLAVTGAVEIQADATTVRQALSNVVDNAIKYAPPGGRIELSVSADAPHWAVVDVRDSGPGVPVSERAQVFERFYRLDKARSRASGGVGLGLAIARWAIEANGGKIGFVDSEGWGACCRIRLPLRAPQPVQH
jgi:heavy metal sensor kinase